MDNEKERVQTWVWILWLAFLAGVLVFLFTRDVGKQQGLALFVQTISAIAAATAAIMAVRAVKKSSESAQASKEAVIISKQALRATQHTELEKLILEINKLMINNPKLWQIYDVNKKSSEVTDEDTQRSIQSLVYYHFNMYHLAYSLCYNEKTGKLNDADANYWNIWDAYIKDFFENCSEAHKLLNKSNVRAMYSDNFINYLDKEKNYLKKAYEIEATQNPSLLVSASELINKTHNDEQVVQR